ncbi:unnamed protein product [Brachionus calyciflorus]|uniref:Uncharacterized protein n=1 Tax=Brachionus calyciflorus TaxID=104777 RepID=A0A814HSN7_9BILA|nr:unnamed protein product [Brachionus calyciflorus]
MDTQKFEDSNNNNLKTPNLENTNNPFELNNESIECLTVTPKLFRKVTQVERDIISDSELDSEPDEYVSWNGINIKPTKIQINESSLVLQQINEKVINEKIDSKINRFWSKFKLESPLLINENQMKIQEKVVNN